MEDYLDEDPTIANQQWVCISIFTPNSIKDPEGNVIKSEHNVRAFKIRGVYATEEQARKRCEDIRRFDKYHNVFIGNVGKWLPWDDDVSNVEEAVYAEKKLNEMMQSYRESQQQAKEHMETRKMDAHAQAKKKKEKIEKEIQEQLKKGTDEVNKELIEMNIIETQEQIETEISKDKIELEKKRIDDLNNKLKEKEEELDNEKNEIGQQEKYVNKIDEELQKTKDLYEKLMDRYNLEKKNGTFDNVK